MIRNVENRGSYLGYKSRGNKGAERAFHLRNKFSISEPKQVIPGFKERFLTKYTSKTYQKLRLKSKI